MRVSTVIILAIVVMAAATFAHPRECRHSCEMDNDGVVVSLTPHSPLTAIASGSNS